MPVGLLGDAERRRLEGFPEELRAEDIAAHFTLAPADVAVLPVHCAPQHQLWVALQLCSLRYLGYFPAVEERAPMAVVAYLARQLGVANEALNAQENTQTRGDHLRLIEHYLGFRKVGPEERATLEAWLLERAMEHDQPAMLFDLILKKLLAEKLVRPGITSLERMVATARQAAFAETFRLMMPLLTQPTRRALDKLLATEEGSGRTMLAWLHREPSSNSPKAIQGAIERLDLLRGLGIGREGLTALNPNRLRFLAQLGRRLGSQALQRATDERRYVILAATVGQLLLDILDDLIEMFERLLMDTEARARHDRDELRDTQAKATNETVQYFYRLIGLVLDPGVGDAELRNAIYRLIPEELLRKSHTRCAEIMRPADDNYLDFLERRYSYLRQCTPGFLDAVSFQSSVPNNELLVAVELIRAQNADGRRSLPADAPTGFVSGRWRPYVIGADRTPQRHYYELCLLYELRQALRSGDIWVAGSRRYANPESYLIPPERWPALRAEVCQQVGAPADGAQRLAERGAELDKLLSSMETTLGKADGPVRMEDERPVLTPLAAEERPKSAAVLSAQIDQLLPEVELSDLVMEVNNQTGFCDCLTHAGSGEKPKKEDWPLIFAALMAHGLNIGLSRMAHISGLSAERLASVSNWYLREETCDAAMKLLVGFIAEQPLSKHWGDGSFSSSDGQRFVVTGKSRKAVRLSRYFGVEQGLTHYGWILDFFAQFGVEVTPSTARDATYVLDAILDNLQDVLGHEHTTDTAGYTELVFALFDLLGLKFSPRLRDIGDQQLYRFEREKAYPRLGPRLRGTIKGELILSRWDDLLRIAGSLRLGWVSSSLLIGKLQARPNKSELVSALQEYGRLNKTIFILRYLQDEDFRRRIEVQLNKGEAMNALRRYLFIGHGGKIRRKGDADQQLQASCLGLLTNAIVAWNMVYMNASLTRIEQQGREVKGDDIKHLSPVRYAHINPYGQYRFVLEELWTLGNLRPLREVKSVIL